MYRSIITGVMQEGPFAGRRVRRVTEWRKVKSHADADGRAVSLDLEEDGYLTKFTVVRK